ncbi:MAG: ParB/Srx family N-terminal domain-containing protein [Candidatus Woesebacteria bacterium]|jgi:hypothetical protein
MTQQAQSNFTFNKGRITTVISRIPTDVRAHYPSHIFDPIRIEIAREIALKEYLKLFPSLKPTDFEQMSDNILCWLYGSGYELAPVSDFWNYIDGMMLSLKFKDIVPYITSANISWELEELDPHSLNLVAAVGNLDQHGQPPYSYEFVNQKILQNMQQLAINKQISDEKSSDTTVGRDQYPIIVRREIDGKLTLLDGNRRTLRALLYGKNKISSWVGTVKSKPVLRDHWVNTGFMRRLLVQYQEQPTESMKQTVQAELKALFNSSVIARQNYQERCIGHYNFAQEIVANL